MMDREQVFALGLLGLMVLLFASIFTTTSHLYIEYCDIYKATVPFGEFVQSGELGGFMFFGFGGISGSFGGDEYYFVKYFDGDELKTLKLDADDTSLIVDGTLRLEIVSSYTRIKWFLIFDWNEAPTRGYYPKYKIHIPYLPTVNQTMSDDWGIS